MTMRLRRPFTFLFCAVPLAVGLAGMLLLLAVLGLLGRCDSGPGVNEELARGTRAAVEMARIAQERNDASYLWPGRLRLVAVALGVGIPVTGAVVVFCCVCRRDLDVPVEVLLRRRERLRRLDDESGENAASRVLGTDVEDP